MRPLSLFLTVLGAFFWGASAYHQPPYRAIYPLEKLQPYVTPYGIDAGTLSANLSVLGIVLLALGLVLLVIDSVARISYKEYAEGRRVGHIEGKDEAREEFEREQRFASSRIVATEAPRGRPQPVDFGQRRPSHAAQ